MSAPKLSVPVPRVTLTYREAAGSLGMGVTSFTEHVLPHVRVVRFGSHRLIPVKELARFVDERAEYTLDP